MPSCGDANTDLRTAVDLRRNSWIVFGLVFIFALSFALFTNHTWEDYYITYRCSKNLATGNGLVFTKGEHVHAFTSPLGVLIPAGLSVLIGNSSDVAVLWLFRIICGLALAAAAVLLYQMGRRGGLGGFAAFFLVAAFGLQANIIDFSINGQEVALMMLFLALALKALFAPTRRPAIVLGLAWGGLMWTRPDSFIYFGALAAGVWIFNAADASVAPSRRSLFALYLKAAAIAALIYLPWFIWAWSYYGSPVPHTIVAKKLQVLRHAPSASFFLGQFIIFPIRALVAETAVPTVFLPPYASLGGWPRELSAFALFLGWTALVCWLLPFVSRKGRAVSFAFFCAVFYLTYLTPRGPWYMPNCGILGLVALAFLAQQGLDLAGHVRARMEDKKSARTIATWTTGIAVVVLLISFATTLSVAYQLRLQQSIIETGMRTNIGLWLKENAASERDTVFLEPLGYIGYYSQLKMYDFPGLASPEVVEAQKNGSEWSLVIKALHPDWLVLRPNEVKGIGKEDPELLDKAYKQVKVFDVSDQVAAHLGAPGAGYLKHDQTFVIYKRAAS